MEPSQLGPIQTSVKVNFPKGSRTFSITAMVVSQNVELLLPDGNHVLESIHFGSMYFGQERTFNAILVNNAPHPSSFNTTIDSLTEDEEFLLTVPEISVEPFSGKESAILFLLAKEQSTQCLRWKFNSSFLQSDSMNK